MDGGLQVSLGGAEVQPALVCRSLALRLASTKVCLSTASWSTRHGGEEGRRIEWDCGERREVVVVGRAISGGRMGHNLSPPPKLGGDSSWAVTITPQHPPKIVPQKKFKPT